MAKRAKKIEPIAETPVAVTPADGHLFLLASGAEVRADAGDGERAPEIHVAGVPYVHTHEDADGRWVYAPRDVRSR